MNIIKQKRELATTCCLLTGLVVCRIIATHVFFLYDDSFITFRYARNLANGLGFIYQAGEHVLGTTTPAYGLLLSVLYILHLPVPTIVPYLNTIFDAGTLLLTTQFLIPREQVFGRICFGFLFIVSPLLCRVCVGGMELSLFLFLSIWSIVLFYRSSSFWAIALASLSYFIRPEGVILAGVLILLEFRRSGLKRALQLTLVSAGLFSIPLLVIHSYYGQFLSQSLVAKSSSPKFPVGYVFERLLFTDPFTIALFPFTLWGIIRTVKLGGTLRIVLIWESFYFLFYLFGRPFIPSWYGEIFYFSSVLWASIAFGDLTAYAIGKMRFTPSQMGLSIGTAVLAILAWGFELQMDGPSVVQSQIYNPLEAWCDSNKIASKTVFATDIGAIGYYSDAHIYDYYGLVTPDMLRYHSIISAIAGTSADYLYLAGRQQIYNDTVTRSYIPVRSFSGGTQFGNRGLLKSWVGEYYVMRQINPRGARPSGISPK